MAGSSVLGYSCLKNLVAEPLPRMTPLPFSDDHAPMMNTSSAHRRSLILVLPSEPQIYKALCISLAATTAAEDGQHAQSTQKRYRHVGFRNGREGNLIVAAHLGEAG